MIPCMRRKVPSKNDLIHAVLARTSARKHSRIRVWRGSVSVLLKSDHCFFFQNLAAKYVGNYPKRLRFQGSRLGVGSFLLLLECVLIQF